MEKTKEDGETKAGMSHSGTLYSPLDEGRSRDNSLHDGERERVERV
jgi:hypothetical protein